METAYTGHWIQAVLSSLDYVQVKVVHIAFASCPPLFSLLFDELISVSHDHARVRYSQLSGRRIVDS